MAYVILLERLERAAELRWQSHAFAKAMGAEGELGGLSEAVDEQREAFYEALAGEPVQMSSAERTLRSALGLKEW
jgi:hypothetical protein